VKMVLPKITKGSPLRAMAEAAAEAAGGRLKVHPDIATFLNMRNKEVRGGRQRARRARARLLALGGGA